MPSIATRRTISFPSNEEATTLNPSLRSDGDVATPRKRRLRSDASAETDPSRRKSRRHSSPAGSPAKGVRKGLDERTGGLPVKRSLIELIGKENWNPRDAEHVRSAKEAMHVSTMPSNVVCREEEQKRVLDFCKECLEREKPGSLYVCGCPGTGKSLSIGKVTQHLIDCAKEKSLQPPDVLTLNCTSLANTSEIFSKIMGNILPTKKANGSTSPLHHLQKFYSQQHQTSGMMVIIADELDYLVTKDRAVLHDLFMLTTFPFSRCILIGVANAIDLADRFLPRLQSLNCKPLVITFRAYSKDQILKILQERVKALPYMVFQPQALELCARKVAAASGDMRKALSVCRSAIEVLEAELRNSASYVNMNASENGLREQDNVLCEMTKPIESTVVRINHMANALSKAYKSPVVDTIQSLPQHQQIILCSAVKFFRGGKKDTIVAELHRSYLEVCKSTMMPAVGTLEFLGMCRVLSDQGLLKLGVSRDDKLKRVTLKVDEADITFALQGVRFFRNCLK